MSGSLFTVSQQQRLKEHKYNAEGKSIAEPLLQPFWTWLVMQMPVWLAPNTITFIGLIVNVASAGILIYHCRTGTEEPVTWTLVLCGVCLFIYQALDAIDGKQAKRLNQSSPLGEVFDHGCDAVSCFIVGLAVTCAMKLGSSPAHFFLMNFNTLFTFYLAHWQGYVSGKLKFGRFDVTEVQLCCITLFAVEAVAGSGFLSFKVFDFPVFGPLTLCHSVVYLVLFSSMINSFIQFRRIMAGGIGKNGSSVADTSVLSPAIPAGLALLSACYIFKHSSFQVFQNEPALTMLVFGPCFAKLTWKVVLASMTKHPVDMTDSSMLGPFALVLINYFSLPVNEYHALIVCAVFECIDFSWYSIRVCRDISICLDLNVFTITPKKD